MTINIWIEVTSGIRWKRLIREGFALEAPNKLRYRNFFRDLRANDIVLHYMTTSLTPEKKWRSSIIAISRTVSAPVISDKKIVARCSDATMFPRPIGLSELCRITKRSNGFNILLRVNMQRYLTKISRSDLDAILALHPENRKAFEHGEWT